MRNMIACGRPLPPYHGCSEGDQSELKDPVLLRDHFDICPSYVLAGAYRLPRDVRGDKSKCITRTDRSQGRRRDLLMELIAANLVIYPLFVPTTLVTVYRNAGKLDSVPASKLCRC